jgi:PIN domain nuclease of toxin-antitoxin system
VGLAAGTSRVSCGSFASQATTTVILLDTNAVIWLHRSHPRATDLPARGRLYLSPASVLEIQLLIEIGRIRLKRGATLSAIVEDERWMLDDAPAAAWFETALQFGWTRDPYDRLIVAHATLRGWKLATADESILDHVPSGMAIAL